METKVQRLEARAEKLEEENKRLEQRCAGLEELLEERPTHGEMEREMEDSNNRQGDWIKKTLDKYKLAGVSAVSDASADLARTAPVNVIVSDEKKNQQETWANVVRKKPVVVKGMRAAKPEEPEGSIVSVLQLKHKPHLDLCVRGIPRLKDTAFKSVKDYNEFLKKKLEEERISVRFVSVYQPAPGDRRGSTFARIGCFKEDSEKILSPDIWPTNVFVREWMF